MHPVHAKLLALSRQREGSCGRSPNIHCAMQLLLQQHDAGCDCDGCGFWCCALLCWDMQGIPDAPSAAIEEAFAAASELAQQLTDDGTPAYIKVTLQQCRLKPANFQMYQQHAWQHVKLRERSMNCFGSKLKML